MPYKGLTDVFHKAQLFPSPAKKTPEVLFDEFCTFVAGKHCPQAMVWDRTSGAVNICSNNMLQFLEQSIGCHNSSDQGGRRVTRAYGRGNLGKLWHLGAFCQRGLGERAGAR